MCDTRDPNDPLLMHGPCGLLNPSASCMVNGRCKHGYPHDLCEVTVLTDDGYHRYARPDNGRKVQVGGAMLTVGGAA